MAEIRKLKAHEIECRAQIVKKKGCSLLLYKDARCDMNILDETFGSMNWQREHRVVNGNLFCGVQVWDEEKQQWITKEDVGVESRSEKEKGQASDAFKRACFNIGIGRELYTAPFIWINLNPDETYKKNDNYRLSKKVNFRVTHINYNENNAIDELIIKDQDDNIRYKMGEYISAPNSGQSQNSYDTPKKKQKSNTKKKKQQLINKIGAMHKTDKEKVEPIITYMLEEKNLDSSNLKQIAKLEVKDLKETLDRINNRLTS